MLTYKCARIVPLNLLNNRICRKIYVLIAYNVVSNKRQL